MPACLFRVEVFEEFDAGSRVVGAHADGVRIGEEQCLQRGGSVVKTVRVEVGAGAVHVVDHDGDEGNGEEDTDGEAGSEDEEQRVIAPRLRDGLDAAG